MESARRKVQSDAGVFVSTKEAGTNPFTVDGTQGLRDLLPRDSPFGKENDWYQIREQSSLLVIEACRYPVLLSLLLLCWR